MGKVKITREDEQVIKEGKIYAVIAYLGILCLFALLLKKDNRFALHHGKQGLVIFIAEVISGILPLLPLLGWFLGTIILLTLAIYSIIGMIQAMVGNYWRAPIVADIADRIKF